MKTTLTLTLRSIFAACALAACNPSLGDMTDTSDDPTDGGGASNTDTNGDGDGEGPGGEESGLCGASNPCPDGQFCFNGICALGCNSDGDCAEDQYCATDGDRLCHNKEVTTCPDVPCADGQVCVSGFCSTPPPDTQCMPSLVDDGCEDNAVCLLASETKAECYTLPYCAEDETCPVGTEGAVCNNGIMPDKGKICLISLCTEDVHCPATWNCIKFEPGGVVGECSAGEPYDLCYGGSDCQSGSCDVPFPGEVGYCM